MEIKLNWVDLGFFVLKKVATYNEVAFVMTEMFFYSWYLNCLQLKNGALKYKSYKRIIWRFEIKSYLYKKNWFYVYLRFEDTSILNKLVVYRPMALR